MTKNLTKEEFLLQHLTEGKSYADISLEYKTPREQLSEWWADGRKFRDEIRRSNQIFNNKKNKEEFAEFLKLGKRGFFEWYRKQPRYCHYCGIEEEKLRQIFNEDTGVLHSKRNRGRSLELERIDSDLNEYSESNCVFACYLCNNHKSDIISEDDHKKYFAKKIREYLENKYSELKNKNNKIETE